MAEPRPNFHLEIEHPLNNAERAIEQIKTLLEDFKESQPRNVQGLTEQWAGNVGVFSFNVKGMVFSGTMTVTDRMITIKGTMPQLIKWTMGATIEAKIRQRAVELLRAA